MYKDKNVLVIGAGKSGVAVANLLIQAQAKVTICDCKTDTVYLQNLSDKVNKIMGSQKTEIIEGKDLLVPSPGIGGNNNLIQKAKEKKIPIESEIEVSFNLSPVIPYVAVTGTNGKSTTTALCGEIFKLLGRKVYVGGNMDIPYAQIILESKKEKDPIFVLEISSYQLEYIRNFRPFISIILNIFPEHLERYQSFADYCETKGKIFYAQKPTDFAIFNADDSNVISLSNKCRAQKIYFSLTKEVRPGVFLNNKGEIFSNINGKEFLIPVKDIKLPGKHNLENILACFAAGIVSGLPLEQIIQIVQNFPGLAHRIQKVRTYKGRNFINDSKATNVDSTLSALETVQEPIILIMGGKDKGVPYSSLRDLIKKKVKSIILLGEAKEIILSNLKDATEFRLVNNLKEAVELSFALSKPGDTILFSPACSSFDMFRDFEERGEEFKKWVMELKE